MEILVAIGIILVVAAAFRAIYGPTWFQGEIDAARQEVWGPEERAARIVRKRQEAFHKMKRLGIKSITEGHTGGRTGWQPVKPMAVKEEAPKNVTVLKRRPH